MANLSIYDSVFDSEISLRDSYQLLYEFILQYHERGESSTVNLLADLGVHPDGSSSDPAQIQDFLRVAGEILGENP